MPSSGRRDPVSRGERIVQDAPVVERKSRRCSNGDPACIGRVVAALGTAVKPPDEDRHGRGRFSRVAVRPGVDPEQTNAPSDQSGLLLQLPDERPLNGLAQFDESPGERPHPLERWMAAADQEDSAAANRHGVHRQGGVRVA
jgi:hypothetical protein